jgi:hypothetical protein
MGNERSPDRNVTFSSQRHFAYFVAIGAPAKTSFLTNKATTIRPRPADPEEHLRRAAGRTLRAARLDNA